MAVAFAAKCGLKANSKQMVLFREQNNAATMEAPGTAAATNPEPRSQSFGGVFPVISHKHH